MKRILLLTTTTGYQTGAFVDAARALGVDVLLGSDRCHVLAELWKEATLPLRFSEPQAAAETIVRAGPFDGVVAIGDATPPAAAIACEGLGTEWHSPKGARAAHDKALTQEILRAAGLFTPPQRTFSIGDSPGDAGVPYPCVVKPLSLSASRGVVRADDAAAFVAAFRRVAALLGTAEVRAAREEIVDRVLAQTYVPGAELAVEGLVTRGRLSVLAIFDKPDPLVGPFFEETIYVTPSGAGEADLGAVTDAVARACEALGLSHGPIHAEVRLGPEGPWVVEVAARPIGGLCARSLRFGETLASLEAIVIRHALGEDVDRVRREDRASGVMMIPVPGAGVLDRVEGVEDAARVPGVWDVRITALVGQKLVPWPEGHQYPGFLFARAGTPQEVVAALRAAHRKLTFVINRSL